MNLVPYKNRIVDLNKPVKVYRNLNIKNGVWYSVKQDGVVKARTKSITLRHATFHVGQGGRQRVLQTGQKNVHAWVAGYIVEPTVSSTTHNTIQTLPARYHPKTDQSFICDIGRSNSKLTRAWMAMLDQSGLSITYTDLHQYIS